ncbi:right-handed parallel beta-helix repeat-containing protein [Sphingobium sp. AN641]|uniref:right-handed parallel beta-helix repeat-containing protein n=1 Tax=Sphingobium sp. AN641 TaxID=3133443 RepID=UPI0030C2C3A1
MRILSTAILLSAAITASAFAQGGGQPFTVAETGRAYGSLSEAIGAIGGGRGTIVIAPGTYRQCAVQEAGDLSLRAQTPGTAIFDGVACEEKAGLVLRGRSATIDGVVFQNYRVPDGNGAGIRLETGNLTITNSLFRSSENGILAGNDASGAVTIDRSTFRKLGYCGDDCAHGIYIGRYGSLTVTRSRFDQGTGGHYIKTRSARVSITDNSFDDSAGHVTNYMIDLSNGSTGTISGNEMVQGRDKDNYSAFITIAPEGRERTSAGLTIANNSAAFVPGLSRSSTFVANFTDDAVRIGANRLASGIKPSDRR